MRKILFLFILLITAATNCFAQRDSTRLKKNSVYGEFLGNCGLFFPFISVNYEHIFKHGRYNDFSVRVGFRAPEEISIPIMVNQITNPYGKSHLEMGIGGYVWPYIYNYHGFTINTDEYGIAGCFVYRYQKPGGPFLLRVGYTPLFSLTQNADPYITFFDWFMIGISAGYCFEKHR